MEYIFEEILKLAIIFYEKGRSYDIPSIKWMVKQADRIADIEDLDKEILLPLIILHDVGYANVDIKNPNVKAKGPKITHMREGAKIADNILKKINYDKDSREKIVHYVSVHDNWALNDDSPFKECKEMAVFNDLDFMYPLADKEFLEQRAKGMNQSVKENIKSFETDEKLIRRPLCCQETRRLFKDLIAKAKKY